MKQKTFTIKALGSTYTMRVSDSFVVLLKEGVKIRHMKTTDSPACHLSDNYYSIKALFDFLIACP